MAVVLAAGRFQAVVGEDRERVRVAPTEAGRVTKALADAGLYLCELRPEEVDLESVFLELTRALAPLQ